MGEKIVDIRKVMKSFEYNNGAFYGKMYDTILTPVVAAEKIVGIVPKEVMQNKDAKILSLCEDNGEVAVQLYNRMMVELAESIPDANIRRLVILLNRIYAVAPTETVAAMVRKRLYGSIHVNGNVEVIRTPEVNKKTKGLGFETNMKFDAVVGNPPYQGSGESESENSVQSIYQLFVLDAIKVSARYVSMIIPIKWAGQNSKLDILRDVMMHSNKIVELHEFADISEIFSDVYISGGVCYFLYDKQHNALAKVVRHIFGDITESYRPMGIEGYDLYIKDIKAVPILNKVCERDSQRVSTIVSAGNPFNVATTVKGHSVKADGDVGIMVTGNSGELRGGRLNYISRSAIIKNTEMIDKHKVLIELAADNMLKVPFKVLGTARYSAPGECCNASYLVVGPFNDKEECLSMMSYMDSKLVRFLASQRKVDHVVNASVFEYVPLVELDHIYTDEELYKKFNLTEEEIAYIENTITR